MEGPVDMDCIALFVFHYHDLLHSNTSFLSKSYPKNRATNDFFGKLTQNES